MRNVSTIIGTEGCPNQFLQANWQALFLTNRIKLAKAHSSGVTPLPLQSLELSRWGARFSQTHQSKVKRVLFFQRCGDVRNANLHQFF